MSDKNGDGNRREILWTPWRMDFILQSKPVEGCVFCQKPRETGDEENYILYRGRLGYIMLNAYPYSNGHLLVLPYEHAAALDDLDEGTACEMMLLTQRGLRALRKAQRPDGFNIGMNLGKVAGAGIADHAHIHIVPRWNGDTNFMPVFGGVRLVPEVLEDTYRHLIDAGIADE